MYFWDLTQLKDDFKNNKFNTSCILVPFLVIMALQTFLFSSIVQHYILCGEALTLVDYLLDAVVLITDLGAIIYIFHCNGGNLGTQFLDKYFVIGFVFGIRWFVLVVIPMFFFFFVLSAILTHLQVAEHLITQFFDYSIVPISVILVLGYYWQIGLHVKATRIES